MPTQKLKRQTVEVLIKEGLGFCCEWAFFKSYKRTGLIAARLGVEDRTIRYHKAAFKAGDLSCEKCPNCLKARGLL